MTVVQLCSFLGSAPRGALGDVYADSRPPHSDDLQKTVTYEVLRIKPHLKNAEQNYQECHSSNARDLLLAMLGASGLDMRRGCA